MVKFITHRLNQRKCSTLLFLSLSFTLSGCSLIQPQPTPQLSAAQQDKLSTIIEQQDVILIALNEHPNTIQIQQNQIDDLTSKISTLEKAVTPKKVIKPKVAEVKEIVKIKPKPKIILGEEEWMWFPQLNESLNARVDTGAATSSLNAQNIEIFERDNEQWARFELTSPNANAPLSLERQVVRTIRVIQSSTTDKSRRHVVSIPVELGSIVTETEFTLVDRSHMAFPVLLGRTFLKDIAVVDVAQRYTQEKKSAIVKEVK